MVNDHQTLFDFGDDVKVPRWTEPRPKRVKVPRESSSLCSYCGHRMPSALLDHTPAASDLQAWVAATPYHADGCHWIESRGLRLAD